MILAIRKPIARFMRYAFGRQYVFVLAKSGRTKLRRVFTSDWNGEEYIHDDDLFPFSWSRVRLKDAGDTFRDWKPATFTEAERKALAVMDAMTEAPLTSDNMKAARVPPPTQNSMNPADFASFRAAFMKAAQYQKQSLTGRNGQSRNCPRRIRRGWPMSLRPGAHRSRYRIPGRR